MTRADIRRLVQIVHDLDHGDIAVARAALCVLARITVPIPQGALPPARAHTYAPKETVPRPKPPKRVEDLAAIAQYRREHPLCEVAGPDCLYDQRDADGCSLPHVHHLIKRSAGGACLDVATNLLALCQAHHTGRVGWHPLGPKVWFKRFHQRLTPEATAKILKAMDWLPLVKEGALA